MADERGQDETDGGAASSGPDGAGASRPPREPAPTLAFGVPEPHEAPGAVDPLVGARVGSFDLVRVIGRGGMGTVYLAEHPVIGSRVAVKFLHPHMAENPAVVARFFDEARAVNLIGHENIVGIFDLSQLPPNRYYFVMEYLEGATLDERLRAGRLPDGVALDVLLQLCDALQCAHERGVVHRDLKPENVFLVSRRGKSHFVKLLDFGIAKLRDAAGAPGRTAAGLIVGTPEYMAPEQCEDREVDARTDVYALGVMAYELVTGRLPFDGRTVTQLLLAHLQKPPPPPSQLVPGLDAALEAAILRALAKDPSARFPDMAAFAAALRDVADRAAAARRAARAAATGTAPAPTPPPAAAPVLHADVRSGSAAPRRLEVAELTRAGVFVRADGALPPLFSQVAITLAHPSLRAPLELAAEVVRHVSPQDAAAWRMAPGFATQFVDLAPEARAALAGLADAARGAPAALVPPAPVDEARLRALEVRAKGTHYAILGLADDAEFADVRRALRELRAEIEAARARPLAPDHPARALALLQRLDAAAAALSAPAARLAHDAQHGNWRGVARCLSSGVPAALVEARRRELHAASPARKAAAERHLARAQVARKLGNETVARIELERALEQDPLDAAAHEQWKGLGAA